MTLLSKKKVTQDSASYYKIQIAKKKKKKKKKNYGYSKDLKTD